jgi:hypothetical protein
MTPDDVEARAVEVLVAHCEPYIRAHGSERVLVACDASEHGEPVTLGFADAGDERVIVRRYANHQVETLAAAGLLADRDALTRACDAAVLDYVKRKEVPSIRIENPEDIRPFMAREIAKAKAEALREAAEAWQRGEWASAPRCADRAQERIANGQHVTNWLRARANQINPEETR